MRKQILLVQLIFDEVYGSWMLSLPLLTLAFVLVLIYTLSWTFYKTRNLCYHQGIHSSLKSLPNLSWFWFAVNCPFIDHKLSVKLTIADFVPCNFCMVSECNNKFSFISGYLRLCDQIYSGFYDFENWIPFKILKSCTWFFGVADPLTTSDTEEVAWTQTHLAFTGLSKCARTTLIIRHDGIFSSGGSPRH